ncbi:MAG: hypothetical protein AAB919_01675 [Patescibacteria group bacterium]
MLRYCRLRAPLPDRMLLSFLKSRILYGIVTGVFDMYGKNRDRNTRIWGGILGVLIIASMIFAYFALLF